MEWGDNDLEGLRSDEEVLGVGRGIAVEPMGDGGVLGGVGGGVVAED